MKSQRAGPDSVTRQQQQKKRKEGKKGRKEGKRKGEKQEKAQLNIMAKTFSELTQLTCADSLINSNPDK